jgi:hypothetical protein
MKKKQVPAQQLALFVFGIVPLPDASFLHAQPHSSIPTAPPKKAKKKKKSPPDSKVTVEKTTYKRTEERNKR